MSLADHRSPHVPFPISTPLTTLRIAFYREEFLRVRRCLESQREHFSHQAVSHVESVIGRILVELEQLSDRHDADDIVEAWLRQFCCIARTDAWRDDFPHTH